MATPNFQAETIRMLYRSLVCLMRRQFGGWIEHVQCWFMCRITSLAAHKILTGNVGIEQRTTHLTDQNRQLFIMVENTLALISIIELSLD